MEIKNLLRIIFRIFGLYSIIMLSFNFLPQQLTYILNADLYFPFETQNALVQTWIYVCIVIILILLVFYLLIINPDSIISRLKPRHFLQEKINFEKINSESLLKVAILSIGVLVLFDSIPELVNKLFILIKLKSMSQNISQDFSTTGINSEVITAGLKTLIGLIFIIFQYQIGKILYRQNVEN